MNNGFLARDIASRFHHRGSYLCPQNSNLTADLRDIAATEPGDQRTQFAQRRVEILSAYGFDPHASQDKPFAYADGIAIIPIHGLLINRFSGSWSFLTGYNFIRSQMNFALADDDVRLIVYDINSGGGLAAGCSELSLEIYQSREVKPSLAVVDARCYSAAYFLGSSATRMVCTPSGGTGSIGCVAMHVDYSAMLEAEGLKVTFITFGEEKVDGNPYQRLSSRAKQSIQRDVDYHGGLFVQAVARNRELSEEDVIATEARCFLPTEALEAGLIDDILPPDEAVSRFFNDSDEEEGTTMSTKTDTATLASTAPVASVDTISWAEAEALAASAARTAAQAALKEDRDRRMGIVNSEEAKDRPKLAAHLADTDLSVDAARAVLAAAAKETPETKPGNGFAEAMAGTQNPNVSADQPGDGIQAGGGEPDAHTKANSILADWSRATGVKIIDLKPDSKAA